MLGLTPRFVGPRKRMRADLAMRLAGQYCGHSGGSKAEVALLPPPCYNICSIM